MRGRLVPQSLLRVILSPYYIAAYDSLSYPPCLSVGLPSSPHPCLLIPLTVSVLLFTVSYDLAWTCSLRIVYSP
jgi:hypothetical protein